MGGFFILIAGLIAFALGLSMANYHFGFLNPFNAVIGLSL